MTHDVWAVAMLTLRFLEIWTDMITPLVVKNRRGRSTALIRPQEAGQGQQCCQDARRDVSGENSGFSDRILFGTGNSDVCTSSMQKNTILITTLV